MNNNKELNDNHSNLPAEELNDRREALKTLGKYAAYVAPFTVMAMSAKAASASGPGPHASRGAGR